jgi:beta-lactamase class A
MPRHWFVLALLAACGSHPPNATRTPAPAPAPATPPAAPAAVLPAGVPDTPVGRQLAWVVDVVNQRRGKVERAEIEAHFHDTFLAQVSPDQTIAVFGQLGAALAPLTIGEVEAEGDKLVAHASAPAGKLRILIGVEKGSSRIEALLFQPDVEAGPKPKSFAEVTETLASLAPRVQLLVAEVDHGTCRPLQQLNAAEPLAIGSTFKLYVLLGLVDRIVAGKASWDAPLAIRDDWKSLPSGTMQEEAAGKTFPILTFAEKMISISDNTATDHLLYTVGRANVEKAVKASRHHQPALNAPFLSTRELFLFKLALAADEVERYLGLPEKKRRAYLDQTLATRKATLEGADAWKAPRRIDKLEWFASSHDLCAVMATLAERARSNPKAAPALDVLAKNPGIPVAKDKWPYVGFKGGSEPGVLNGTWLLRRDDGRWFVVTASLNDTTRAIDEPRAIGLATGIFDLLAKEGR